MLIYMEHKPVFKCDREGCNETRKPNRNSRGQWILILWGIDRELDYCSVEHAKEGVAKL